MGAIIPSLGGGGGVSSDELTATLADVIKGKTVVASDTDDEIGTGTLELTGDAGTDDVVANKGFYTTDPKTKQTGTLADKNGTTQSATASLDTTNNRLQMAIPALGRYNTNSKLYAAFSTIASLIGLTAAKLANGVSILGLTGTYKGVGTAGQAQVLTGYTFSSGSLSGASGTMPNNGAVSKSITPSSAAQSYTIPGGWHNGSGKVTVAAIPVKTGTLTVSTTTRTFTLNDGTTANYYYFTASFTNSLVGLEVAVEGGNSYAFLECWGSLIRFSTNEAGNYKWATLASCISGKTLYIPCYQSGKTALYRVIG